MQRSLHSEGRIVTSDAIRFALGTIIDELSGDLHNAGLQSGSLSVFLPTEHDQIHELVVGIARPTAQAATLLALARARLEHVQLNAPVTSILVRAEKLEECGTRIRLFDCTDTKRDALALAIARIQATLGGESILERHEYPAHAVEHAFTEQYSGFSFLRETRSAVAAQSSALVSMRLLYRILLLTPIIIRCQNSIPVALGTPLLAILECAGPWRSNTPRHDAELSLLPDTEYDEYDVLCADGRYLRIRRTRDGWQLCGCYD